MRWDGGNCLLYAAHSFIISLTFLPSSSIMMDMVRHYKNLASVVWVDITGQVREAQHLGKNKILIFKVLT